VNRQSSALAVTKAIRSSPNLYMSATYL